MIVKITWRDVRCLKDNRPENRWCFGWFLFGFIPLYVVKGAWR